MVVMRSVIVTFYRQAIGSCPLPKSVLYAESVPGRTRVIVASPERGRCYQRFGSIGAGPIRVGRRPPTRTHGPVVHDAGPRRSPGP